MTRDPIEQCEPDARCPGCHEPRCVCCDHGYVMGEGCAACALLTNAALTNLVLRKLQQVQDEEVGTALYARFGGNR